MFLFCTSILLSQKVFDTKFFGQQILDGKVSYDDGNEEKMFQTLDSLFCKAKDDKFFYFQVANRIQRFSDGALSEYFSGVARKYYMNCTKDFLENTSEMKAGDLDNWLKQVAFDLAADAQDISKLPDIRAALEKLLTDCRSDETKKNLLKKCNATVYKQVEANLKD